MAQASYPGIRVEHSSTPYPPSKLVVSPILSAAKTWFEPCLRLSIPDVNACAQATSFHLAESNSLPAGSLALTRVLIKSVPHTANRVRFLTHGADRMPCLLTAGQWLSFAPRIKCEVPTAQLSKFPGCELGRPPGCGKCLGTPRSARQTHGRGAAAVPRRLPSGSRPAGA